MTFSKYLRESMHILELVEQDQELQESLLKTIGVLIKAVKAQKPILICGNGGSASDAEHFAAELVGRYLKHRPAIKAYALTTTGATLTALSNDFGYDQVFARQVEALGEAGGVLIGLTTSGKSKNILEAFKAAREKNLHTIALIGSHRDSVKDCNHILSIPSAHTPFIQQAHLCLYHYICEKN